MTPEQEAAFWELYRSTPQLEHVILGVGIGALILIAIAYLYSLLTPEHSKDDKQ